MDLSKAQWVKSTRSGSNGGSGSCVEVARNLPGIIAVRDSKNPAQPALTFPPSAWRTFLTATTAGEFTP
jgi:hypothetical protein